MGVSRMRQSWANSFVAQAGAAAALTGLLFDGVEADDAGDIMHHMVEGMDEWCLGILAVAVAHHKRVALDFQPDSVTGEDEWYRTCCAPQGQKAAAQRSDLGRAGVAI